MLKELSTLLITLGATILPITQAQALQLVNLTQWNITAGGNGHFYGLTDVGSSWTEAELFANSLGGHLVSIDNAIENEFLRTEFLTGLGNSEDFWIGLYSPVGDFTDPGTWSWVSGSTSTYRNWRPAQPDFGFGDDRYAAINFIGNGSGQWDNYPDSAFRTPRAIVEFSQSPTSVPEPLSIVGITSVLGFSLFLKRHSQN
ncbi:MAG: PEP-CTERM sorting domain-containing protein [Cyanobacteria bacterium P01_G01_bin.54]